MCDTPALYGGAKRSANVPLAYELGELARSVLPGKGGVVHEPKLRWRSDRRKTIRGTIRRDDSGDELTNPRRTVATLPRLPLLPSRP